MKRKVISVLAMILAVVLLAAGCGQGNNGGKQTNSPGTQTSVVIDLTKQKVNTKIGDNVKSAKDTLVISIPTDPGSMDLHYTSTFNYINQYCVSTLLRHEYSTDGSVNYVCNDEALAASYKLDDDNMGVTFNLRQGVKFHNGYSLKANDVIFSIRRCSDLPYFQMVDFDNIKATDDYTVYVPFKYLDANAVYCLGIEVPIYSEQYYYEIGADKDDADFCSTKINGTGPYKLVEWKSGDYLNYEAFDDYFAGKPKIKHLKVRIIKDSTVAFMELQNGGVDIIAINPNWSDVEAVIKGDVKGINVWEESTAYTLTLGFNNSGPLSDIRIRKAIAYALDKEAIAEGGYQGSGVNSYSILSMALSGTIDYKDNWPYPYDPEKAKQLLKDAGIGEGKLNLKIIVGVGDALRMATAEAMGAYLKAVGINLEINTVDIATYAATIAKQPDQWDMFIRNFGSGLAIEPSAHAFFKDTLTVNCHISDQQTTPKMLELATRMGETFDTKKRNEIYKELQDYYLNECLYTLPLVQNKSYILVNEKLKNVMRVGYDTWSVAFGYFEK
ncbi:MAG: ABC transporter substrate-binding protein [Acetivibrionales bacterium]|jgi:peptide/nickel transport system substrate-binding protein